MADTFSHLGGDPENQTVAPKSAGWVVNGYSLAKACDQGRVRPLSDEARWTASSRSSANCAATSELGDV